MGREVPPTTRRAAHWIYQANVTGSTYDDDPRTSAATRAIRDGIIGTPVRRSYLTACVRGVPEGIRLDVWICDTHLPALAREYPFGPLRRYAAPSRASTSPLASSVMWGTGGGGSAARMRFRRWPSTMSASSVSPSVHSGAGTWARTVVEAAVSAIWRAARRGATGWWRKAGSLRNTASVIGCRT